MGLSRRDIVDAAFEILDEWGLADLTMRRIATTLGVQPGALYWHFANKQTLLGAISDEILSDLPDLVDESWPAAIRIWASSFHSLLRKHRSGAELVASVVALRPWQDSPASSVEQLLLENEMDPSTARALAAGILHLVLGHTADEEQSAQLKELGVKDSEPQPDSAAMLDRAVQLLLMGAAEICPLTT